MGDTRCKHCWEPVWEVDLVWEHEGESPGCAHAEPEEARRG